MKKTFLFFLISLLTVSLVLAANGSVGTGGVGASGNGSSNDSGSVGTGSENASGSANEVATQTANKGGSSQLQVQTSSEFGYTLRSGSSEAKTSMKMTQQKEGNETKNFAELSNGMKAEIKIMPNTASEKALEVLNAKCEETGCTIELKEVVTGDEIKVAYEVKAKKDAKFLGLFKTKLSVEAEIDAETGETVRTKKAWWAFLASE